MKKELSQMTPEEFGKLFPIILSEHNTEWKNLFKAEKEEIKKAVGSLQIIRVEHIGSTAIPDLISKPTIDILLEIRECAEKEKVIDGLKRISYQYIPKPENPPPHMMFVKGYTNEGFRGQTYHIHVRYHDDWDELYFRDFLKKNLSIATEYGKLKQGIAAKYRNDRDGYTDAKSEFVKRITVLARSQ